MMEQITDAVLMVRPVNFRLNEQTMTNNFYQKEIQNSHTDQIKVSAQHEFDLLVGKLKKKNINVCVINDTTDSDTPDSIFPNNWVSFHDDGTAVMYPMYAENRRQERRRDVFNFLAEKNFNVKQIIDYTEAEKNGVYLEGTGSMLLDRENKKAYCSLSPRSNERLFYKFCDDMAYHPVVFNANQIIKNTRKAIYHTNVMMSIGTTFAIICIEAIDKAKERKHVIENLQSNKKEIITITQKQVEHFAGNMLQLRNSHQHTYLVMSTSA